MDWNSAQANWQQFRCEVHANWGRLTCGHLDAIAGRRACLANKIEEAYGVTGDRKSTRLNSSHEWISYAVFCLKKKNLSEVIYVWCYCWRYCFCSCWWRHV